MWKTTACESSTDEVRDGISWTWEKSIQVACSQKSAFFLPFFTHFSQIVLMFSPQTHHHFLHRKHILLAGIYDHRRLQRCCFIKEGRKDHSSMPPEAPPRVVFKANQAAIKESEPKIVSWPSYSIQAAPSLGDVCV